MSTPFKPEWLQPGAVIPVDIPTLAAFAEELCRVNQENQALRQALETEQEPVAWRFRSGTWFNREVHWRYIDTLDGAEGLRGLQPLYTAPPKREWVGLTEKEVKAIANKRNDYGLPMTGRMWVFVADLTDKLKEKNHGDRSQAEGAQ